MAEAKISVSYVNGMEAIPMCNMVRELEHSQPLTPMQVYNNNAVVFQTEPLNITIQNTLTWNYIVSSTDKNRGI